MTQDYSVTERSSAAISRRGLLKGAGGFMMLSALSGGFRSALASEQFDLIVLGGGTAGIPAAIFAAQRGARVLVVEKATRLGGTLFVSGGRLAAANTVFQQRLGIKDSADAFYDDVMRINNNTSDPALTRLWAEHSGETVNWLASNGFDINDGQPVYAGSGYDPYTTRRYQWGPRNGLSILSVMEPILSGLVESERVEVLLGAGAVDLIKNRKGEVTGVVTEDEDGKRSDLLARNVLIASGGCAANATMFENLHGVPLYSRVAYRTSQGAGLMLGLGAGGYLRGAEDYLSYFGSILADDRIPSGMTASMSINPEARPPWELFINARGERFVQEDHPSLSHKERALGLQPGHRFWAVFDQEILDHAPPLVPDLPKTQLLRMFDTHPMFARASTLSELGVLAELNPAGLEQSVNTYNAAIKTKAADQFGRTHRPRPILKAPFYAIRSQGWTLKSFAGLAVNNRLQVIDEEHRPIGNLYAAGEVLGAATSGNAYTNGGSVTPAVTFGRLLGKSLIPV